MSIKFVLQFVGNCTTLKNQQLYFLSMLHTDCTPYLSACKVQVNEESIYGKLKFDSAHVLSHAMKLASQEDISFKLP